MNELAKNTLCEAVKPLAIWQASPTKQSCIFTLFTILDPSEIIEFSQMTPVPMNTLAFSELSIVQSLNRLAPDISQSSCITVFVISRVLIIFTLLPMVPRSGLVRAISSETSLRIAFLRSLSLKCLTMNAANWLFKSWNSITFPSPTSLSTAIRLPSP